MPGTVDQIDGDPNTVVHGATEDRAMSVRAWTRSVNHEMACGRLCVLSRNVGGARRGAVDVG